MIYLVYMTPEVAYLASIADPALLLMPFFVLFVYSLSEGFRFPSILTWSGLETTNPPRLAAS